MKFFLAFSFSFIFFTSFSQDFSNKGKDFWVGYGSHCQMYTGTGGSDPSGGGSQDMVLYFTSDVTATVNITNPSTGWTRTYTVIPNTVTETQAIPKTGADDVRLRAEGKFSKKSIHITSDQPIVAYAHIYNGSISGATLLFPTNTLGKEYYSLNYKQTSNQAYSYPYCFAIATEDNTIIEVTPTAATQTHAANIPFRDTLMAGDVLNLLGQITGNIGVDLTGTKIKSVASSTGQCKRIAVFSGSGKLYINCAANQGNSADNYIQQDFPSTAWGQKYFTAPTKDLPFNYFRVLVKDPATIVKLNGVVQNGLQGSYYDLPLSNIPNLIEADKPVVVAQYITTQGACGNGSPGDPEMIYLSPVEQTIDKVTLNSTSHSAITKHYINVVIKTSATASFRIDGTAAAVPFTLHPQDPLYSYIQIPVTPGPHTIQADSGFNAIAYGYGSAESYGYNAGTNIRDLTTFITPINPLNISGTNTACAGTPFYFSITYPFQPTSLSWDFHGFQNPNVTISDPTKINDSTYFINGKQVWRYKLPTPNIYSAPGNYPVSITSGTTGSDDCGNLQTRDDTLYVFNPPITAFSFTHSGCASDPVSFTDNTNYIQGTYSYKWYWNFGDGKTDNVRNPVHLFATPGVYNVRFSLISNVGCLSDTATKPIVIAPQPIAKFNISTPSCFGNPTIFTDLSSEQSPGNIVKWFWDYGDGQNDTLLSKSNPVHTYAATATYNATLKVESNTGCQSVVFTLPIVISPNPVAGFILPEVCLADASAQFTDTSKIASGSITNWVWNFGDSPSGILNTSSLQNPKHKYNAVGNYTVSLTITSNNGCTATLSQTFTVNGDKPAANFVPLNASGLCANDSVSIQNTSTVNFGTITKVEIYWDNTGLPTIFDTDDFPAPGKIYKHLYPNLQINKTYTIKYIAYSGGAACTNIKTMSVTVNAAPKVQFLPIRDTCFNIDPFVIIQAKEIGGVPGAGIYSGQGIVNASGLFDPKIAGVGPHTIRYTFTSNKGCIDFKEQTINVLAPPVANFNFSNPNCVTRDVIFSDSSVSTTKPLTTWIWNFGDGTTVTKNSSAPFTHVYQSTKTYNVTLTITTGEGCNSLVTKTITINPLPVPDFSLPKICLPNAAATFNDLSMIADGTSGQFTYLWNFGDPNSGTLNTSSQKNPTHIYSALGPYNVTLQITSNNGCTKDTVKVYNDIHPQPKANFAANPLSVCVGTPITFTDQSNGLDGSIQQYQWSFGDGKTSSVQNPVYTYSSAGTFNAQLFIVNSFGCVSDTAKQPIIIYPYPNVNAGPDRNVLEGGSITLEPIVSGNNLQYLWTPNQYLNNDTTKNPIVSGVADITYTLTVTAQGGCVASDQVMIKVLKFPKIPNTFTPNNDGINDYWVIENLDTYPDARVQVFNRYGQLVFESKGYSQPWNGNMNGKPLPFGTYYYVIEPGNGRKPVTGYVTIIK